jgi:hypothetical protein
MRNCDINPEIENIVKLQNREEAFYKLVTIFIEGPEQVREHIRKDWDYGVEWIYPNIRRLACIKNESRSSQERILALLVRRAIEDFGKGDMRDNLIALAVIYHSCVEAGLNPQEEFETVASIAPERTANILRGFVKRDKDNKSLEAFKLTAEKNLDGEIEIYPSWYGKSSK